MRLLAIDTSTEACSVALLINDCLYSEYQLAPQKHNELILPMINQLLKDSHTSLADMDAFAFGAGPGSFTGLRISAGLTQGFAYGNKKPVIPISTLAALAQGAYRIYQASNLLPALDARMHQIYFGIYQINSKQLVEEIQPDQVLVPEQITTNFLKLKKENLKKWFGIGTGWATYSDLLIQSLKINPDNIKSEFYPHAQDIAVLAKDKFEKGETVNATQALPSYLLSPQWDKTKTK